MAWEPAPQRRILLEAASFVYAFGNTRHRSLLRTAGQEEHRVSRPGRAAAACAHVALKHQLTAQCSLIMLPCSHTTMLCNTLRHRAIQALLLGFGDVRHVLATAAACAEAGAAAAPRALAFHLNDVSPLNVARGVLLLHLVSSQGMPFSAHGAPSLHTMPAAPLSWAQHPASLLCPACRAHPATPAQIRAPTRHALLLTVRGPSIQGALGSGTGQRCSSGRRCRGGARCSVSEAAWRA